ncbi:MULTISPECIES: DUF4244 domain-containing protein [Streptomyces]|uniref:DUF4244 domain-containing protein n=2 Tax=Streptomyces TaxID=1883 RepID=A0ABV9IPQ9_9ACTN
MYKAVRARLRALVCGMRRSARGDAGMVTSEYATGIVAAVGLAVLLYQVVTSDVVEAQLQDIVKRALDAGM